MRIKKTSETTPSMASVVNEINNSTTDTYSCKNIDDRFNGNRIYAQTEIDTGKLWIDGKSIYRKVVSGSISGTTGTIQVPNLETLVKYYGICTIAGGTDKRPFPFYEANTSGHLFDFSMFGSGFINYVSNWSTATYTIVLEYTKSSS